MSVEKRKKKKMGVGISKSKKLNVKKKRRKNGNWDFKYCSYNKTSKNEKSNRPKSSPEASAITAEKSKHMCRRYEEFHNSFINYDQIVTMLGKIQKKNPGAVDLVTIGHSGQGKPIFMVFITTDSPCCVTMSPRHATFIEAGLNGEDTIAVSNALFMIDYLTKNPHYVSIMDYIILPCGNPDAYDKFVKSKVNNGNNCGIKRTRSHGEVENKKPRLEKPSPNKRQHPKNATCTCAYCAFDESKEVDSSDDSSDSSSEDLRSPYVKSKESMKGATTPCTPVPIKRKVKTCPSKASREGSNGKPVNNSHIKGNEKEITFRMDLSMNFPVVLGLNDMRRIPTNTFLEKITIWKENFLNASPETYALIKALNSCQFAVKLLISLQEGGETICYPYGFCDGIVEDSNDLNDVAKKGKYAITSRNFQYGPIHEIRGLTYGNLIDFVKVDRGSIKYTFVIQVHKKSPKYDEKRELKQLMAYGCDTMKCIKNMSTAVFKFYTNMTGNKTVETVGTKPGLDRRSNF